MPFEGLGADYDDAIDALPAAIPAAPTPPVAAPAAPATVAPPAPPPAAPVVAPPAAAAASDSAAPAAPAAEPAALEDPTDVPPADISTMLATLDEKAAEFAQSVMPQFQLTPEQITELETDAAAAMPKLLTNVYTKAVKSTLSLMQAVVPQMIQQTIARDASARDMETQFFKQWGNLDAAKHGKDIRAFAQTFAKATPGIDRATLFSMVGAAVSAKHGLAAPAPSAAPAAPVAPAATFTPAVASAPVVHTQTVDASPFAGMGMNFDDD